MPTLQKWPVQHLYGNSIAGFSIAVAIRSFEGFTFALIIHSLDPTRLFFLEDHEG